MTRPLGSVLIIAHTTALYQCNEPVEGKGVFLEHKFVDVRSNAQCID